MGQSLLLSHETRGNTCDKSMWHKADNGVMGVGVGEMT